MTNSPEGRKEVVVAIHGEILAFAPQTGERLWSCQTEITWYMAPSLIAHDGVVYCLGGRSGVASRWRYAQEVTATSPSRTASWKTNEGSNVSSPVFHAGHLYWMND